MGKHLLSGELTEWATGPASKNPEHTRICHVIQLAAMELDALTAAREQIESLAKQCGWREVSSRPAYMFVQDVLDKLNRMGSML